MVPGDVLLVTAFLSYMGCFTRKYRHDLMFDHWLPFLEKMQVKIPRTTDLDILALLTDDAQIAQWNNEGEYIFLYFFIYINKRNFRLNFKFKKLSIIYQYIYIYIINNEVFVKDYHPIECLPKMQRF